MVIGCGEWHDGIGTGVFGGLLWVRSFLGHFLQKYLENSKLSVVVNFNLNPPKTSCLLLPLKKWIQVAWVLWDPVFQANLGRQRSLF